MKLKDLLWVSVIALIALILIIDHSRETFITLTKDYPYLMGFVKVAILATMGELLARRVSTGKYKGIVGIWYKLFIWGFIGMTFAVVFPLFSLGVEMVQSKGLLTVIQNNITLSNILDAFLKSFFMNLIFAPTFMAFHRITDTYIELGEGKFNKIRKVKLNTVINKIDWNGFIGFVVLKTIPFFWIPAHTITFLLPQEFYVLFASGLSIALGLILTISKKKKSQLK